MKKNLKYFMKELLSDDELDIMPTSFDTVGDLMLFSQFPEELEPKQKEIAQIILDNYAHIKVVLKKTEKFSGVYRLPTYAVIAGEQRTSTVYKESGVTLKLDVNKVYFSPRLSTERLRVANLVQKEEVVLVMFSGCGVYPVIIAKNAQPKKVVGVEINPDAHTYALENASLNKKQNLITLHEGDVRNVLPTLHEQFDRIIMPLPHTADNFLDVALARSKKGTIIHFYHFGKEEEYPQIESMVVQESNQHGHTVKIIQSISCGEFGPGINRVCVDVRVE